MTDGATIMESDSDNLAGYIGSIETKKPKKRKRTSSTEEVDYKKGFREGINSIIESLTGKTARKDYEMIVKRLRDLEGLFYDLLVEKRKVE